LSASEICSALLGSIAVFSRKAFEIRRGHFAPGAPQARQTKDRPHHYAMSLPEFYSGGGVKMGHRDRARAAAPGSRQHLAQSGITGI